MAKKRKKDEWMNVEDAAKAMRLSTVALYVYLAADKMPNSYKHNGTQWRVSLRDVESFKAGKLNVSGAFGKGE